MLVPALRPDDIVVALEQQEERRYRKLVINGGVVAGAITLEDGAQWQFSETVDFAYRPPRAGSTVEIDRNSAFWKEMQTSGGLALHVAGDFPNLEMTLWAIRGD